MEQWLYSWYRAWSNKETLMPTDKHYVIFDEHGEVMRWVKTKHEAEHIVKTYKDWSYMYVPGKLKKLDLPDAPF